MSSITSTITVNNKKYPYTLTEKKSGTIHLECVAAKISKDLRAEDVAHLLLDLPNLIIAKREYEDKQIDIVRFRVSSYNKRRTEANATKAGIVSTYEYLRHLTLNA